MSAFACKINLIFCIRKIAVRKETVGDLRVAGDLRELRGGWRIIKKVVKKKYSFIIMCLYIKYYNTWGGVNRRDRKKYML